MNQSTHPSLKGTIPVRDAHNGELLPFCVPEDFFDNYSLKRAAAELNVIPAPGATSVIPTRKGTSLREGTAC